MTSEVDAFLLARDLRTSASHWASLYPFPFLTGSSAFFADKTKGALLVDHDSGSLASRLTVDVCLAFGSGPDRKISLGETIDPFRVQVAFQLIHKARKNDVRSNESKRSNGVVARGTQTRFWLFDWSDRTIQPGDKHYLRLRFVDAEDVAQHIVGPFFYKAVWIYSSFLAKLYPELS